MQRVIFVRHGATEPNLRGVRCGGDVDPALTPLGREQSRRAALRVQALNSAVRSIVTSELARTLQTATIISELLGGVPITIEPMLNERRLGEWNGRDIAETEPLLARGMQPPGGESEATFVSRVSEALNRLSPQLSMEPLIVGSSGVARVLNTLVGGGGRLRLANGEVTSFLVPTYLAFEAIQ
jgi:2,3-bisphosphoglycerate-dependent phosphoglycerate mutase